MKLANKEIYITSDSHFAHSNICKGVTKWPLDTQRGLDAVRDFKTLEEMNKALVDGINNKVDTEDMLIHLGDWSFGGFENIQKFRDQINCNHIVLLLGNHDHHIENNSQTMKRLFKSISKYEEFSIGSTNIVACHYPIISWNRQRKGTYMLHGHQHLKGEKKFGEGKRMDVGFCGSPDFAPYHISEIINLLKDREALEHH